MRSMVRSDELTVAEESQVANDTSVTEATTAMPAEAATLSLEICETALIDKIIDECRKLGPLADNYAALQCLPQHSMEFRYTLES